MPELCAPHTPEISRRHGPQLANGRARDGPPDFNADVGTRRIVRLASVLPVLKDQICPLANADGAWLRAVPALQHFAAIRVMELTK